MTAGENFHLHLQPFSILVPSRAARGLGSALVAACHPQQKGTQACSTVGEGAGCVCVCCVGVLLPSTAVLLLLLGGLSVTGEMLSKMLKMSSSCTSAAV